MKIRYLVLLFAVFVPVAQVMALDPLWTAAGSSPVAITADGGYVLADGGIFSQYNRKGETVWRGYGGSSIQARGGEIFSPLKITRDGMYSILGTNGGLLYIDRSQRIFWQDPQYRPIEDIALSPDENYVASIADGRLSVYTRGGELVWRNSTYSDVRFVDISSGGLMTVAGSPDIIHAFNQTGFELWNYTTPGIGEIVLSQGNSDILASSDYTVICLHPSGNLLWRYYTGSEILDIGISGDGSTIAAGNQGGVVSVLDRDGKKIWSYKAGNWIYTVSLSGDGSLVATGGIDRKILLFGKGGGLLWEYTTGGQVKDVAISADGSALAAGAEMVYYFSLQGSPPSTTTAPQATSPTQVTTGKPPSPPTRETVARTPGPAISEPIPVETTPESGTESLAFIALALGSVWFLVRKEK
ncbi:MAG: PQQ-binding-like beta-propeller repeat protein [Methanomicrobiales archaeon]|nr:PQQ-binding-like beta-propeller repeat protein [Methanomicrobiales archaeon]